MHFTSTISSNIANSTNDNPTVHTAQSDLISLLQEEDSSLQYATVTSTSDQASLQYATVTSTGNQVGPGRTKIKFEIAGEYALLAES